MKTNDIIMCKMISGEEVIGKLKSEGQAGDIKTVKISDPCVVIVEGIDPNTNGISVKLMPYSITDPDGDIELLFSAMAIVPKLATESMTKLFVRSTSNIVI